MRQPVHVVYGGAHLFRAATVAKLGALAARSLADFAPNAETFAAALGLPLEFAPTVFDRVQAKLANEAIEDYRIDFEDGFGIRSDEEEDAAARDAARELMAGMDEGALPPFIGFRIKSLAGETRERGLRTLRLFLDAAPRLPEEFVVTLPKITELEQVDALMEALEPYPPIGIELMVETPMSLQNLAALVERTGGRCVGAHFGPYDYTSALGITSHNQHLLHPACHFARSTMLVALGGRGIALSDGPTNILPIPPHRGAELSEAQRAENRRVVERAWKLHYTHVRDALYNGFYQGWDLHPAQLPVRYAAVYSFFLEGLDAASERLRNFVQMAAKATRVGEVFDDAATGQGLLNYFLRAASCGAIPEAEIPERTGLTLDQLRTGSFAAILKSL